MDPSLENWLNAMPLVTSMPFSIWPDRLYEIAELYKGLDPTKPNSYMSCFDWLVYQWTLGSDNAPRQFSTEEMIAARMHDTEMERRVKEFLDAPNRITIGFMGGHSVLRTDPAFAAIAKMARELRRNDFLIVTGGGPGMMEAANLGAFLAPYADDELEKALETMASAPAPGKAEQNFRWVATAAAVRERLLGKWDAEEKPESSNLGIPTWYYGSEPPNIFSTVVAKYFLNSLREDGLVTLANGGLFFGKGDAGTVQEVFQNATVNYYQKPPNVPTPMVFFDVDFWDPSEANDATPGASKAPNRKPVFPLIKKLAHDANNHFSEELLLTNDPDAAVNFFLEKNTKTKPQRVADKRLATI